jgi:N-acyl-D-aspartate/D-glutamate deacylase
MLDLLIKNARIVDGTGSPSFMGDLGVQDGLIRSVSRSNGLTAERVLDAGGLVAYDLPCNGRRLVSESEGIKATFVSGIQLYEAGKHTGAMPGRILRSYE